MADDNKPKKTKIDLKARLGKTTMTGVGGVPLPAPGPSAPGSGPPSDPGAGASPAPAASPSVRPSAPGGGGIAPPPGISPGIPLPPFAQQRAAAAQPAPKPTAVQQTIKVEVGEEVEQERKKANKRAGIYAALAAVLGIGMGFIVGGAKERGERGQKAVNDAVVLEKDMKTANDKLREMNDKLTAAGQELGAKTFPKTFAQDLSGMNIPFEASNLAGKQIGSLPPNIVKRLFDYTQAVTDVNKTKDSLRNLLGMAQAPVEKSWKEEKEPVVNFGVVFRKDGEKTLAELVPVKEPFPFGKDWPEKLKVTRLERTQQGAKSVEKEVARWTKGDLTGSDLLVLPIDPPTVAAFTSEQIISRLAKEMRDLRIILEGNTEDPTAGPGLVKQGDDLANELHKIGLSAR
ncbi:hypothetical protein [Chondromyces apiculatus]|uniref:Protein diaphanous related formin-2 n=1 Tax=Chondromyces apiculatus DSM 436 TaxID=1192034 RepID=A0A017T544_9BACT|nr:hypothetical protein [Chondromyces apiculatus]EYF03676.1 Protein diaphanous related formin-2 [Chondromyces apiculatus DSM 436]